MIYENICFEGGGIHGYAYCGAIKALEELGLLSQFKRFSGASVGALVATMLSCGFTFKEISTIPDVFLPALEKITSQRSCGCGCAINPGALTGLLTEYGMYEMTLLEKVIAKLLGQRVSLDVTLAVHHQIFKMELVIVACSLNRKTPVFFHHATYPNVTLKDALLASMAVPLFFKPRKIFFNRHMDYFVDGGLVQNYPLWVFNDLDLLYNGNIEAIPKHEINSNTLGLKLYSPGEAHNYNVQTQRKSITNILQFVKEVINTIHVQLERNQVSSSYLQQTIPIEVPQIHFLDFQPERELVDILVKSGETAVFAYFKAQNEEVKAI